MRRAGGIAATGLAALGLALAVLAAGPAARAQEPPAEAAPGAPAEEPQPKQWEELPPSGYAAGDPPAPVERTLKARPKKVWAAILEALEAAEIPVEAADPANGYLKTQLIIFEYTRFGNVATPPPTMSLERPIRQLIRLNQGKFSVEIQTAPAKGGTLVSVRAYIEEHAPHVGLGRRIWVERYSNGTIENYVFERIEKALR